VPAVRRNGLSEDRLTLGSIRPFPGKSAPSNLADVWRLAAAPGAQGALRIRATRREDIAAIRALQHECAPHAPAWSPRQLEAQIHAFPAGQVVVVDDGGICGAAAALVVDWKDYACGHTWRAITADGTFATHHPGGSALYAAGLFADTSRRGFGVARALVQAQRRVCRRLNLPRILGFARLAGYAGRTADLSPDDYALRVVWGDLEDAELRFRLAQGFQFCGVLRDYMPEDADAGGHAALLAWLNPLHAPPGPPASILLERRRRAA
jgi:GNAT superfamily N-acetyltransferase